MKLAIDFGTCFSLPAVLHLNQPVTLLPPAVYGIPSVFYYDEWEGVLTGEAAEKAGQGSDAVNLKRAVKLSLSSSFTADGKTFTGKQIAAAILREVCAQARVTARTKLMDDSIEGAVISVPAAFTQAEKRLLYDAASMPEKDGGPGLTVLGFIKEPVAAALAYFRASLEDHSRIFVYDLGGGTFDIAIVEADSTLREKYTVIDSATLRIGGNDWDSRITLCLSKELEKMTGIAVDTSPALQEKVLREATAVKHAFSQSLSGGRRDRVRARIEVNGRNVTIPVTAAIFDELTGELFRKTVDLTKQLLARNSTVPVRDLICVGGSSNMPQVQDGLAKAFPDKKIHVFEPEKAIACGAAVYAASCDETERFLSDIASFSYGTDCYKDFEHDPFSKIVVNLIRRGERLPVTKTDSFRTVRDGQRHMYFDIFETESDADEYGWKSGVKPVLCAVLDLPKGLPKGTSCKLNMTLSADGLLSISALYGASHKTEASLRLYE